MAGSSQCVLHIGFLLKLFGLGLNTGHCYFLRENYFRLWPVSFFGFAHPGPAAGRPPIFSLFAFSQSVVGFVRYGLPPSLAAWPTTYFFKALHFLQFGQPGFCSLKPAHLSLAVRFKEIP